MCLSCVSLPLFIEYVSKQGANVSRFREDGSQAGTSRKSVCACGVHLKDCFNFPSSIVRLYAEPSYGLLSSQHTLRVLLAC